VKPACCGRLRFRADTRYISATAGAASDRSTPLRLGMSW
jgi:hypothetical protein